MSERTYTRKEFRQAWLRVSEKNGLGGGVSRAVDTYLEMPENAKRTVFRIDELKAVRLIAYAVRVAPTLIPPSESVPWLEIQPLEIANSTEIQAWAKPWAEAVRLELFGSDAPPFDTPEAASRWILDEAAAATPDAAIQEKVHAWERHALTQAVRLTKAGVPFDLSVKAVAPSLMLPDPTESRSVSALWSPSLNRLAHEADAMAKATGWDQGQTVAFILVKGVVPFVQRIKAKADEHGTAPMHGQPSPLVRRWFDVRTQGADVTRADLTRFFTQLRLAGLTVKKPVSQHELDAYLITQQYPEGTLQQRLDQYHEQYPEHRERITTVPGYRQAVQKVRVHIRATVGSE